MSAIPQDVALTAFLAAVAGNEPPSSLIETRWREGPGQPMHSEFMFVQAAKANAERVRALAGRGDVYIGAAPRTRSRGTAASIARCWTLWVDLDVDDAVQRLDAFTPRPSLVMLTGTGGRAHALWPLREPLAGRNAAEHVKRANRRIAHALGGDMNATDLARILRAPTTANHKHQPPKPVEVVRLELATFTAREVVGHLADPIGAKRPAPAIAAELADGDALRSLAAADYAPLLTGREVGRDGKMCCPFHEDRTPSLHAYSAPERGWVCYGCQRGGSIIDFGAALYDIAPRGRGFHEIRRRLASDLLRASEVAA